MSSMRMQHVRLFSESVENSWGRDAGASSSDIAESEMDSSSTTGAVRKEYYFLIKKCWKYSKITSHFFQYFQKN
jgi:hypothetical protein